MVRHKNDPAGNLLRFSLSPMSVSQYLPQIILLMQLRAGCPVDKSQINFEVRLILQPALAQAHLAYMPRLVQHMAGPPAPACLALPGPPAHAKIGKEWLMLWRKKPIFLNHHPHHHARDSVGQSGGSRHASHSSKDAARLFSIVQSHIFQSEHIFQLFTRQKERHLSIRDSNSE